MSTHQAPNTCRFFMWRVIFRGHLTLQVELVPNVVLLMVPTKSHQFYWVPVEMKSICARFRYLGAHLGERGSQSIEKKKESSVGVSSSSMFSHRVERVSQTEPKAVTSVIKLFTTRHRQHLLVKATRLTNSQYSVTKGHRVHLFHSLEVKSTHTKAAANISMSAASI